MWSGQTDPCYSLCCTYSLPDINAPRSPPQFLSTNTPGPWACGNQSSASDMLRCWCIGSMRWEIILLPSYSHKRHSPLNGVVQILARRELFDKHAYAPFCLANSHIPRCVIWVRTITATCGWLGIGTKSTNNRKPNSSGSASSRTTQSTRRDW